MERLDIKSEEAKKLGFEIKDSVLVKYHGSDLDLRIPDSVDGVEVTTIGRGAFINQGIENVVIPNTVKRIEFAAFMKNNLREVVIPESVKSIEDGAFTENKLSMVDIKNKKIFGFSNNVFAVNGEEGNVIIGMIRPGKWKVDTEKNIWIKVND